MLYEPPTGTHSDSPLADADLQRLHQAGGQAAKVFKLSPGSKAACAAVDRKAKASVRAFNDALAKSSLQSVEGRWLQENFRLIVTAQKETRSVAGSFREFRTVEIDAHTHLQPLPYALATSYVHAALSFFSDQGLISFLNGFQEVQALDMGELWAIKPALQLVFLDRIAAAANNPAGGSVAGLITSLRNVAEAEWKDLFEQVSAVHRVLGGDPDGAYPRMDFASREQYRSTIAGLAKNSDKSEHEVASLAISLASNAQGRRSHVGYWLLDRGLPTVRKSIGYRARGWERVHEFVLSWPQSYYLIGVELITLLVVFTLLDGGGMFTPTLFALFLLILPVTQAAVDLMNNLTSFLVTPRVLPKLDFSEGIPEQFATLVAVPTLLLNDRQVLQLVRDLEIRYLANRNANLYFALVSDSPDSEHQQDHRDVLAQVCAEHIEALNRRYGADGGSPFFLLHRHRTYNPSEGRWMGWERKRGKLLDLNQLLRGGADSFPIKVGNAGVLPHIKYVLTLDSDTQLPRDAAHKLVGAIAHPLHRAVVDPKTRMVVAGYGILQPRIGISIDSASSSRLASIYSGQTGFDIYTRAISDVYQDLFAEGIFTGKGIYDVDAVSEAVEHRFPENALLSHDLIEGVYARAALVSDIELIDDYPSHFSAYSRRKHRWVRGDWQIMRWLSPVVPNLEGSTIPNPISHISRWKIVDNLRRSLIEPATLFLLVAGWFWLRGTPAYWTLVIAALVLTPVYASLIFSILRMPKRSALLIAWAKETVAAFFNGHIVALLWMVFLLHQAMLSIDAIVRSVLRMAVTKKRLLEWETAAEAENAQRRAATVDVYLSWSPLVAAGIAALLSVLRPRAVVVAAPVLFAWMIAPLLSAWLNRAPRGVRGKLRIEDETFLRTTALRTWRYFREFSTADNFWLIPDNVREEGIHAERLSPTNLGLLLNARVAAVHFGYLTLPEFAEATSATLQTITKLLKHDGHILNWYSTRTLQPLEPRFVSTVDSGNLVACLWTVKQAALSFAEKPPSAAVSEAGLADVTKEAESNANEDPFWHTELADRKRQALAWEAGLTPELTRQLQDIASTCDSLAADMDFSALYQRRKKLLSIGLDADTGLVESSSYDLLASEARIGAFAAIAKGDVPQESWFHLGRRHTIVNGQRVLLSWTGTMFEYLMPALWMKHYRGTILDESLQAVVRVQQKIARLKRMPWGISESGCTADVQGADYGYHAFGIPDLAIKRMEGSSMVVSPYSTFLALAVNPGAALANLRSMEKLGWTGRYGFYEAADYRHQGDPEVIRSWMAHHQGMSLLAVCNLLFNDVMREYFHAEPQVLATELLVNERVPTGIEIEKETVAVPTPVVATVTSES